MHMCKVNILLHVYYDYFLLIKLIANMVMCWAPECKHYNQKETCKFFKFPKHSKERLRWKKLVRRPDEPGPGAFLCSCHFPDGKRENGPQIFEHNKRKRFTFSSPEKKGKRTSKSDVRSETVKSVGFCVNPKPSVSSQLGRIESSEDINSTPQSSPPTVDIYENPEPSTSTSQSNMSIDTQDIYRQPAQHFTSAVDTTTSKLVTSTDRHLTNSPSKIEVKVENYFFRKHQEEKQKERKGFSFEEISGIDHLVSLYTGLPGASVFNSLFQLVQDININYYLQWNVIKVSKKDQLFMCLMKLRQNFPHEDLAHRFAVSKATVTNIVITWIHVLHEVLFKQLMSTIPSRAKNQTCLPNCFSTFTNCRIILDCTEMATIIPKSMSTQKATYSSYKHRHTWKALIGVAPNGVVTFVSELYPGSTSDKKIVQHCKVLEQLNTGDLILADKGFLLKDILPPGVHLNVPPFLTTTQFTPEQVYRTETIAKARIHVERAIRRMKKFQILNFIPHTLQQHASYVVQVIGALTNLQPPLIKEVKESYSSTESD